MFKVETFGRKLDCGCVYLINYTFYGGYDKESIEKHLICKECIKNESIKNENEKNEVDPNIDFLYKEVIKDDSNWYNINGNYCLSF